MVTNHRQAIESFGKIQGMEDIPFSPENLKKKRLELELSRKFVADETGLSESLIYGYERGTKTPTVSKLSLLGLLFTKVSGKRIKFSCEWDKEVINEYATLSFSEETFEKLKAAQDK